MTEQKSEITNVVVAGTITNTSDKQSARFKQEVATKTAYIDVPNEQDRQALIDFGMTLYTPEDGGNAFFIAKMPAKGLSIWSKGKKIGTKKVTLGEPNFQTVEHVPLGLSFIRGEKDGNPFYRLQAVNVIQKDDIFDLDESNPFE